MKLKKGYLYLLGAALSYASMGILVKLLSIELTPLWQVFLRLSVSALLAYLLLYVRKKKIVPFIKRDWPLILFMGSIAYASNIIAFTFAFNYTTVGNVLFILSSYPLLTALFARIFLKEKISKNHFFGLCLLVVGLIFIFNPSNIYRYLFGNVLSLYVAFAFSLYVIISRYFSNKGEDAETVTFLSIGVGAVTSLIMALLFDKIPTSISVLTCLGIVVFGFVNFLGHLFVNFGFKSVKVSTGTMILMLEALIGSLLAFVFFKEVPTLFFLVGACFILSAVYISVSSSKS